jgi:hypothetical protein
VNLVLTRQIAVFQARIQLLDGMSDAFTELSDMQAHRKLKADVEEFISLKSSKAEIPADPLEYTSAELARIETALTRTHDFYNLCLTLECNLKNPQPLSLTQESLESSAQNIAEFRAQLRVRLGELARRFREPDWDSDGELRQELLFVASTIHPDLKLDKLPRAQLLQLVRTLGPLHDEIQKHLSAVETRCQELLRIRVEHLGAVETASDLASLGDYLQARVRIGPLQKLFADVDYDEVISKCDQWEKPLTDLKNRFSQLRERVLPMITYPTCFANPYRASKAMNQKLQEVVGFEAVLTEYKATIAECAESDFSRAANQTTNKLLTDSRNLLKEVSDIGDKLSRKTIFQLCALATAVTAVVWVATYLVMRLNTALAVSSTPSGAQVLIDGETAGQTPLTVNWLNPGQRHITFKLPNHLDKDITLRAQLNRTTKLEVGLERDPVVVAREKEHELALQKEKQALEAAEAERSWREREERARLEQERREHEERTRELSKLAEVYAKVATPGNAYTYNYTPSDGRFARRIKIEFTKSENFLEEGKLIARVTYKFDDGSGGTDDCVPQLAIYEGRRVVLLLDEYGSTSTAFSETDIRISKDGITGGHGAHRGYILEFRDPYLYLIDEK